LTVPDLPESEARRALHVASRLTLIILLVAIIGTGTDLLLLEHFADPWQFVPLVLLSAGLVVLVWHGRARSHRSHRMLHIVMALFAVSGVLGTWLHYRGNVEFEREQNAALGSWALFREAMMGATPALAPGIMIYLGLLGIVYGLVTPPIPRETNAG
jgi:hypothetical protein